MKLHFAGTRGNIEARTDRHRNHSALIVSYYGRRVLVDAGEDWNGKLADISPSAIVLTHAHPDHAWGLKAGAPCPVYATDAAWGSIKSYPIEERHTLTARTPFEVSGIRFEAFGVEHSTRAPAVGFRIQAGRSTVFYVPDVVYIHERSEALQGVKLYVGDGATIKRSMVRKRGDHLIGHTPVRTQLTWCQKEGVPKAVITHCGSEIVKGDERSVGATVRSFGRERGVDARIAYDGLDIILH